MERLHGPYLCLVCHRTSPLGWLYRCTQDDQQYTLVEVISLASDSIEHKAGITGHLVPNEKITKPLAPLARLSPWVQKAIQQEQYTPDQIVILRAQRQMVIDAIEAAESYMETLKVDRSATLEPLSPVTSPSIEADSSSSAPAVKELLKIQEAGSSSAVAVPENKPTLFPYCKLQYCPNCRPTFRDRTWLSFENTFTRTDQAVDIDFERDNRPISHADNVRKLGTHKARWSGLPLRCFNGPKRYSANSTKSTRQSASMNRQKWQFENVVGSYDLADQRTEPESKGFRDGVKRAFRGMLMHRRRSTSTRSSTDSGMREDDASEWDVGLWRDLNDELLQEASNVPLPGHDGMDGLGSEEGEIEVEEGVAVTEEGVDLGTADIIMSV